MNSSARMTGGIAGEAVLSFGNKIWSEAQN